MTPIRAGLKILRTTAVVVLALGIVACDNPVEQEDHAEGLVVLNPSGTEVARYMVDIGVATAPLSVALEGSTTFTVHAVSADGARTEIDGDELFIEVSPMRPGWTASLSGVNRVTVSAESAGTSPLLITLFHVDHEEFGAVFQVIAG